MYPRREFSEQDMDQMVAMRVEQGLSKYTIARKFHTHARRVEAILLERGVKVISLPPGPKRGFRNMQKAPHEASEERCLQWLKEHGFR